MGDIVLINITGKDGKGLDARFTGILAQYNVTILDIGQAKPGDKTLLDTLSPAVRSLDKSEKGGKLLPEALAAFEQAAKEGMESTKDMLAKTGRASRLGERTIGHQDAGATSCYFILRSLASSIKAE